MKHARQGLRSLVLPLTIAGLMGTASAKGPKPDRVVTIDHECYVDYYMVNVRYDDKHKNHTLRWAAENSGDSFDIVFYKVDGNPCLNKDGTKHGPLFSVTNGNDSDKCYPDPNAVDHSFEYSIYWHNDNKNPCLDPVVIVQDGNNSDLKYLEKLEKRLENDKDEKQSAPEGAKAEN